jgi:hypothetical protein
MRVGLIISLHIAYHIRPLCNKHNGAEPPSLFRPLNYILSTFLRSILSKLPTFHLSTPLMYQ